MCCRRPSSHRTATQERRNGPTAPLPGRAGDLSALADIAEELQTLADFYPKHIEKGDKVFFPASRVYFTDEEDQAMLAEFWEFDRKLIYEKYKALVESLGG